MAYGIQIKDSSGNIKVEYTDRLTRLLFTKALDGATSYSIDASDWGFNKNHGVAMAVSLDTNSIGIAQPHFITYSDDTTIVATPVDESYHQSDSVLHVFMYKS